MPSLNLRHVEAGVEVTDSPYLPLFSKTNERHRHCIPSSYINFTYSEENSVAMSKNID